MPDPANDNADILLEALPDDVIASMETRQRWLATQPFDPGNFEYVVSDLQSWTPGQTIRVAFLGGSTELYKKVEKATKPITDAANLKLSFKDGNTYRTWTERDSQYAAEIRVSFDQGGYFSLVGTDSVSTVIGGGGPVGGKPNQRSLNLGGFDRQLPTTWQGTARHEFLHALSFKHEHQNMRGPCELAFRWDDDPGYQPTRDNRGTFVTDSQNRRPGIYTYLSGAPNNWSKAKVDHNLRTNNADPTVAAGPFDAGSVMLYRFPPLFYKSQPSPCAPTGDGQELSDGDIRALKLLYPGTAEGVQEVVDRRDALAEAIQSESQTEAPGGLESLSVTDYAADALGRLSMR
jgi:hypothetical protein